MTKRVFNLPVTAAQLDALLELLTTVNTETSVELGLGEFDPCLDELLDEAAETYEAAYGQAHPAVEDEAPEGVIEDMIVEIVPLPTPFLRSASIMSSADILEALRVGMGRL